MMKKAITLAAVAGMVAVSAGAAVVISDDFNTSQGIDFTPAGFIGASNWNVTRSGDDWGARIHGNILDLTNTAAEVTRAVGWVFASQQLSASGFYHPTLANSGGRVTWSFNMWQIRANPAGFVSGSYGVAFVLGSTWPDVQGAGSGYAVVLGNSNTPDPVRLVSFAGGLSSLTGQNTGLIVASSPLDDPTNSSMSIKVTYDPSTHEWVMYGRNDGASFSDPLSGTLTNLGSATDSSYTGTHLPYMGAYWQGSTAENQWAFFDNVTLRAIPEPGVLGLLLGAGGLLLFRRVRG